MSIFADEKAAPVAVKFGMSPDIEGDENTVWIKASLTMRDRQTIESASYSVEFKGGEAFRIPVSSTTQTIERLKVIVTDWDGPMFEKRRYQKKLWDSMDPAQVDWWIAIIDEKANELYQSPTSMPPVEDDESDPN